MPRLYNLWVRTITLSALLWPIACSPLPATPATVDVSCSKRTLFVFRGDTRSPQLINSTGGFFPFSSLPPTELGAYSIYNHAHGYAGGTRQTIYISTTTEFCVARRFAKNRHQGGYVYRIHAAPNMIDVVASLREANRFVDEKEMIAMGVITWRQVMGWFYIEPDPPVRVHTYGLKSVRRSETNKDSSPCKVPRFDATGNYTSNPDYDATFNALTTSGPQPQLAGPDVSEGIITRLWHSITGEKNSAGELLKRHAREFMERTAPSIGGVNMTMLFDVDG